MRTLLIASLLLISNVLLAQRYSSSIKSRPNPARVVNDYGSFLSFSERNSLEKELIAYRKKSGNAIVVITLSTLPFSIEETALQYFNKWGIGDRRKNNGVLILVSRNPRSVRITTGIGVENILTDYDCGRIIDETIVPAFKEGDFYAGIRGGVNDIEHILGGGSSNRVYSGGRQYNTAPVADINSTQTQTQAQAPTQPQQPGYVSNWEKRKYTPWEVIRGFLTMAVIIWLRVRYVRWQNPPTETYSTDGAIIENARSQRIGTYIGEYAAAALWVFLIMFKLLWWCLIGLFALLGLMFGLGGLGLLRGMGSSSSGAGASFGGGRSSGGGASGSW